MACTSAGKHYVSTCQVTLPTELSLLEGYGILVNFRRLHSGALA